MSAQWDFEPDANYNDAEVDGANLAPLEVAGEDLSGAGLGGYTAHSGRTSGFSSFSQSRRRQLLSYIRVHDLSFGS